MNAKLLRHRKVWPAMVWLVAMLWLPITTVCGATAGLPAAVRGKVTSGTDLKGLPGVSVAVKGTTQGTITDANGNYQLEADDQAVLVFSFIGYATAEVPVGGRTIIDVVLKEDVKELEEVTVVSTGYQEVDKRLFTGAVVNLAASDVKSAGTTDVSRMLQGKAAGVAVQNVSGTFGAAPKIRIRGATSINGDNKPLWVIDGVVLEDVVNVSADQLANAASAANVAPDKLTSGDARTLMGSSVAGLNSDDIESFTILKDASATALYGARAKDGVIVIKTKKGRVGQPLVTYTGNFSTYLKPTYDNFNVLNSGDQMALYQELERKGWLNHSDVSRSANGGVYRKMYDLINTSYNPGDGTFGLVNTPEARAAFLSRYAQANTDWFDLLFKNSFVQEHSIGVSSGTEKSQLYFSTSYYNDNGWTIADNVKRYTINARGTFNLTDKLTLGILATGSSRTQRAPGTVARETDAVRGAYTRDFDINPFSYALRTSRVLTAYDEKGNREYFTRNYAPFNILDETEKNHMDLTQLDLKIQGELGYKITRSLRYDFVGAVRRVTTDSEHSAQEGSNMAEAYRAAQSNVIRQANKFLYTNPDFPDSDPVVVLPEGGFYNRVDDQMNSYYFKNQLNWSHTIHTIHTLNAVAGQEIRSVDRTNAFTNGYGYQFTKGGVPFTDYRIIKQLLEGNFTYFGKENTRDRYASFFASGNYAYRGKYIVNVVGRMDGSNRLGESRGARWLPTWNVSGAWNVDAEPFMERYRFVDFLTVRAGYGLTANAGNATNSSVVYRSSTTRRPFLYETESQIAIESLENADLTWEKQYEANIGINTGLFNKLNITFDYYRRNQFDLIGVVRTSAIGGEWYKTLNYADMESHGIDLSIGTPVYTSTNLSWTTNLIFSSNKSKITSLRNEPRIMDLVFPDGGAQEGYPVRGLYSVEFTGLDPEKGTPLFINQDGEENGDVYLQSDVVKYLKYEGPIDPTYSGGWTNVFRYKAITLNIFLTYQGGNKIRLNSAFRNSANGSGDPYNDLDAMPREFLDRWVVRGDEQHTNIPSIIDRVTESGLEANYGYYAYNYSTVRVVDGGFVRLRTVALTCALPSKWLMSTGLKSAALSLTGTNLWLIYADKRLHGQDPEFFNSGGVAMPVARQLTASVKLSF